MNGQGGFHEPHRDPVDASIGALSSAFRRRLAVADAAIPAWWSDAWQLATERTFASSRTTDTTLINVPGTGRVVRKRWRWPRLSERLKGVGRTTALARSPAEREFDALGSGAPGSFHPAALGWAAWRERGLLARCALLLAEVPGAVDLATWLREEERPDRRQRVLDDLATRVRRMHDAGVVDGDLHPRNVLVEPATLRTWNVDCRRQRRFTRAPRRRRLHDLACLDVGLARFASRTERLRALDVYAGAEGARGIAASIERLRAMLALEEEPRLPPERTA